MLQKIKLCLYINGFVFSICTNSTLLGTWKLYEAAGENVGKPVFYFTTLCFLFGPPPPLPYAFLPATALLFGSIFVAAARRAALYAHAQRSARTRQNAYSHFGLAAQQHAFA
jgi:hypothetical protein